MRDDIKYIIAFSGPTCPVVLNPAQWSISDNGRLTSPGTIVTSGNESYFSVEGDNNTANNSALRAEVRFSTTIEVTQGQVLTFSYRGQGNYGYNNKSVSEGIYARLLINGNSISGDYGTQTDRYGNIQLPIRAGWQSYTTSWTANQTGPVNLQWLFVVPSRAQTRYANDDIRITLPTIVCS